MTITVAPARNEYTSNAGQTTFNYTFKIFSINDLNVYITPAGQSANDSTDLTASYSVDPSGINNEDGGFITLSTGANAGDLVTIVSDVPSSRTTDYQNNGDFRPDAVNADFDRVVSIAKKIEDTANRTVLLAQSQQDPKPLTLPKPVTGKLLRWNDSNDGLENVDAQDIGTGADPTEYLQSIARAFNVKNSQVIDSTDTATILDGVLYIYDSNVQRTWSVPDLDSTGETIVSVTGSTLITTGGTGGGTYTLITVSSQIFDDGITYEFSSVQNLTASVIEFPVGKKLSTGVTRWKITADVGLELASGQFANPLNGIHAIDYELVTGGVADDTVNLQQAMDDSLAINRCLVLPPNKIGITEVNSQDAFDYTINSNSCELVGLATSLTGSMLVLKDWVQSSITGHLTFRGNQFYNECFWLKSSETTKGTRNNGFHNFTTYYTKVGVRIGQSENERQNSENTFFNLNCFQCPTHVRIGGAQTGASFVGCNLFGQPDTTIGTSPIHAIWMEGGFCTVSGGELLTTQSNADSCVLLQPNNAGILYPAAYPQLSINGTHVETASPLALFSNPFNHTVGEGGRLSVIGCQGYAGTTSGSANWISAPADFAGRIQVKTSNFYAGVARASFNISCGDNAVIDVDKTAFGKNFRDWMGGSNGGKLLHSMETIVVATGSGGVTYVNGAKQPLIFGAKSNEPKYTRYNSAYDLATGVFTAPAGGLSNLSIEVSFIANPLAGSLFLEVNGVQTAYGIVSGISGNLSTTLTSLSAGDTVVVYFQAFGSDVTMIAGTPNRIAFTASTD